MGVAAPRASFGGWVRDPLKSLVTGPSLLVNCYLEIKFHKKIPIGPPPLKTIFDILGERFGFYN